MERVYQAHVACHEHCEGLDVIVVDFDGLDADGIRRNVARAWQVNLEQVGEPVLVGREELERELEDLCRREDAA